MVIAYHPATCADLVRELQGAGVLVFCYNSLYKAPVLEQVQYAREKRSRFEGGAQPREDAEANAFWESLAIDPRDAADGRKARVARDDQNAWGYPFSKLDYPAGWCRVCPLASTTGARAAPAAFAKPTGQGLGANADMRGPVSTILTIWDHGMACNW